MTKQFVTDFARKYNCETHYQGSTQTMFVHGDNFGHFFFDLQDQENYNDLAFKVEQTLVWPLPIAEPPIGNPGIPVEALTNACAEVEIKGSDTHPAANANRRLGVLDQIAEGRACTEANNKVDRGELKEAEKANQDAKRKLLDEYLIANPVDRNVKGCYNKAAEQFEVTADYVRDRYRKLRAKGLVEKEILNA